jgi:polysaccharide export outer membrane protein
VGPTYVLGQTIPEVTENVKQALSAIVRYPQVSVAVTNFGERLVFVMGEVNGQGDFPYHHGLTALGAIAEAGGFTNGAKRGSVIVLRRVGPEKAIAIRLDLRDPLKGHKLDQDLPVKPFDIIYVPKTFIASVDVLMDQYFRQLSPPFTLYIDGWNAFHIDESRVSVLPR